MVARFMVLYCEPFKETKALVAAARHLFYRSNRHPSCPHAALERLPEAEVYALHGVTVNYPILGISTWI